MKLYHASNVEVSKPDLVHSRKNLDFGVGFYTTPIYEQALSWANRFQKAEGYAVISEYVFDKTAYQTLSILKFDAYSEDWLNFIISCRIGKDNTTYDIVIGGIANDKVFNTIELYLDNLIDRKEAIKRLKYEKPNSQYCFRTEKALGFLSFERSNRL